MPQPKLIRDKIPEMITADGRQAQLRKVVGNELIEFLFRKCGEELRELDEARNLAEAADVLEAVSALFAALGFSPDEVEAARVAKQKSHGGFTLGLVLESVDPRPKQTQS